MSSIGARNKGFFGSGILPIVKRIIFTGINNQVSCKNSKMTENIRITSLYSRSPGYQLFIALIYVLGIGGVVFLVLLISGMFIFDTEAEFLRDPLFSADMGNIMFLRYLLISQHISLFIIPGVLLINKLKNTDKASFHILHMPELQDIAYVTILALCLIPLTGFTGELNSAMKLPEWLSGVEDWMRGKENMAGKLFEVLMTPDNIGSLAINLLMIALLPAIGEELIFRGIFQRILTKMFSSGHVAVMITAFFFSALHFQFYGFIPRFILGLVYGYLFLWSGTLWLPVIAHFINNALSVIITNLQSPELIFVQHEIPALQRIGALILPVLAGSLVLRYFRRRALKERV